MRTSLSLGCQGVLLATAVLWNAAVLGAEVVSLPDCLVSLKEEVLVPAQEAGVLMELPVHLGQQVRVGDVLAQIDDTIPNAQVAVSQAKLAAAEAEAASTVAADYAKASFDRAMGELRTNEEANRRVPGTIPDVRIDEYKLKCTEARLSIKKAEKDQTVAGHQAKVAAAELRAAMATRDHRRVMATLDGEVVEIPPHVGEWLQAGQPIMRIVRMDQLWINGLVDATKYHQADLRDMPVTVVVNLARGRQAKLPGKVSFVSPVLERGKFLVRAEVENRQENGVWVLNPGLYGELVIHLK